MTRRDQTLRSWIERDSPRRNWISRVSTCGATHSKSTHTRIRKAARQFNLLHTAEVLFPTSSTPSVPHHQPELFQS